MIVPKAEKKSVAELRGMFGRPRLTVPLYLNAEAVSQVGALGRVLERARELDGLSNDPDAAPGIERDLAAAREVAEASRVEFELVAISHRAWSAMIAEHPPTPEQLAEAPVNDKPIYNIDTIPGELVRAQMVSPDPGTPQQWAEFWDDLSDGQLRALWTAAQLIQMSDGSLGKSVSGSAGR